MLRTFVLAAALLLAATPGTAQADWLFTPNIGVVFGGSADSGDDDSAAHFSWGASFGWMGAGIVGWEVDFAHTPKFFESDDGALNLIDDSNVTSLMGNVIIGIPVGGQAGGGFRPYATAGAGLLQTSVNGANELFDVDNNDFGVNVGVGAFGFMSDHVGLRGDLRYFRSLSDPDEDNEFDIDFGDFDFWRGTVGVTLRW